ncbi:MAG: hypothetical protein AB2A00_36540 [Myxococcota bacterium]
MPAISSLPPSLQSLANRIDVDARLGTAGRGDGQITTADIQRARASGLFSSDELTTLGQLERALQNVVGTPTGGAGTSSPSTGTFSPVGLRAAVTGTDGVPGAHAQNVDVRGVRLEPGKPFTLPGVDVSRPIAYVSVETVQGGAVEVTVGRDRMRTRADGSSSNYGFDQATLGEVTLKGSGELKKVTVHYADPATLGSADYYSIPVGKDGIKHGAALTLPIPSHRQGMDIQNIDVSFHAPLREYDATRKWENKPTYCTWYTDDTRLMRKFVDPNADNGNAAEIDNVHPSNDNDAGVLAKAGKTIRIVAENGKIPADENAMTVQWVRVTYKPKNAEVKSFSFKGAPLANREWEGKWVPAGQALAIDVDPTRRISRVEVQWSDKPDDVGYNSPGKWATGSLYLDGKPVGKQREHVGSPEWQFFDNLRGAQGSKLEIKAESCAIKFFEVKVYYEG